MNPEIAAALIGVGVAQFGALIVLVFRAGALVQAFKDHVEKDDRLFDVLFNRTGLQGVRKHG